jgi:hypothetical protein
MPAAKYRFSGQQSYEHSISRASGGFFGTIRIKPSTILWKPQRGKGKKPWFSVDLDEFIACAQKINRKVSK